MFPAERRRQIAKVVNEQGSCSIAELARMFDVSEMTIHRDLSTLEQSGLLRKARGGAVASGPYVVPVDYRARLQSYEAEKDRIGQRAVELIQNGETIFLDAGTTCLSIARHLAGFADLTVYTSGPLLLLELAQAPHVEVHSTGGLLSKRTMAYVGPEAERVVSRIRADKCFIGASGFTIEDGVTDPLPLESSIKRAMVENALEVIVVATPDKFGRVTAHVTAPVEAIDTVMMNRETPEQYAQALTARGIRCIVV